MRTNKVFVAGFILGIMATVATTILFHAVSFKFWQGARNGFLVGVGIVFASVVLNNFSEILDSTFQRLRKGE